MKTLKIGQRVKLRKDSEYYGQNDGIGTVVMGAGTLNSYGTVKWDKCKPGEDPQNGYRPIDLDITEEKWKEDYANL